MFVCLFVCALRFSRSCNIPLMVFLEMYSLGRRYQNTPLLEDTGNVGCTSIARKVLVLFRSSQYSHWNAI